MKLTVGIYSTLFHLAAAAFLRAQTYRQWSLSSGELSDEPRRRQETTERRVRRHLRFGDAAAAAVSGGNLGGPDDRRVRTSRYTQVSLTRTHEDKYETYRR